jgi:hypothetical protein
LLRRSNYRFVPASELRNLIYLDRNVVLALLTRGWVGIRKRSIFEPGEPQRANACGLLFIGAAKTSNKSCGRGPSEIKISPKSCR